MATQSELKKRLKALLNRPENHVCADCPERQPRWASLIKAPPGAPPGSLPIGAFICLECSGSHRRLGVHISFVRSISLDSWKESEVVAMEKGGNKKINAIYECHLGGASKPTTGASGQVREHFIRNKYDRRKYFEARALDLVYGDNANDSSDESSSEEEVVSRAPSNAARLRAQQRSRVANKPTIVAMPKRRTARTAPPPVPPPQTEVVDLLDFTTPVTATPPSEPTPTQISFPSSQPQSAAPPPSPQGNRMNGHISSPSPNMPRSNENNVSTGKMSSKEILAMFNSPNVNTMQPTGNRMNTMMQPNNNMSMVQGGIMPNNHMMQMQQQQNQQQMMMMMMMQNNMMQQPNNNSSGPVVQGMQNMHINFMNNNNMPGMQNNNMMQEMQNKSMMQGMQLNIKSVNNGEQSIMMQEQRNIGNVNTNNTRNMNNMSNQMPMGGMSNQMIMGGMPNSGSYNPMAGMQHTNQQQQYGGQNNKNASQNTNNNSQLFNTQFGGMGF